LSDWEKVEAEYWKPTSEGDELVGVLVDVQTNVGQNGSMLYTIEQMNGERIQVWGSTVLDTRLKNTTKGDEVKIVYLGLGEKKGGKQAPKLFDVYHRKSDFIKEAEEIMGA
jgi:hypothetical protein